MKKRKPQIVWMVKSSRGWLYNRSACHKKSDAIANFLNSLSFGWDKARRAGYSVVRVELREVRDAK